MKIKKGDEVLVISGKDKGKTGKVLKSFPKENKILIQGINLIKKHLKPKGAKMPKGQILTKEAPLFVCKVKLICPKCQKPTRIGFKKTGKGKVRICKKCFQEI